MKEDILEQLVDDYLQVKGYFTIHNVKFLPNKTHLDFNSKQDSNHSDIDVVGFNPKLRGANRVLAVSCKSWQSGFKPARRIKAIEGRLTVGGREAWRAFRELVKSRWGEALIDVIEEKTGSRSFTYVTAVTKLIGKASDWEQHNPFIRNIEGNPIKVLTLQEILNELYTNKKATLASSDVGRLLQVIRASGWKPDVHASAGA